jgi:hypothetical protein
MPWRLKQEVILILLSCLILALTIIVFVLNQNTSSDLLAVIGLLGGLAIIINTLPTNGHEQKE